MNIHVAYVAVSLTVLLVSGLWYCKRASAKEVDYLCKLQTRKWQTAEELKRELQEHCGGWLTRGEVKKMLEWLDRKGYASSRNHTRHYRYPDDKEDIMSVEVVEYKLTDSGAHRLSLQMPDAHASSLEPT